MGSLWVDFGLDFGLTLGRLWVDLGLVWVTLGWFGITLGYDFGFAWDDFGLPLGKFWYSRESQIIFLGFRKILNLRKKSVGEKKKDGNPLQKYDNKIVHFNSMALPQKTLG